MCTLWCYINSLIFCRTKHHFKCSDRLVPNTSVVDGWWPVFDFRRGWPHCSTQRSGASQTSRSTCCDSGQTSTPTTMKTTTPLSCLLPFQVQLQDTPFSELMTGFIKTFPCRPLRNILYIRCANLILDFLSVWWSFCPGLKKFKILKNAISNWTNVFQYLAYFLNNWTLKYFLQSLV